METIGTITQENNQTMTEFDTMVLDKYQHMVSEKEQQQQLDFESARMRERELFEKKAEEIAQKINTSTGSTAETALSVLHNEALEIDTYKESIKNRSFVNLLEYGVYLEHPNYNLMQQFVYEFDFNNHDAIVYEAGDDWNDRKVVEKQGNLFIINDEEYLLADIPEDILQMTIDEAYYANAMRNVDTGDYKRGCTTIDFDDEVLDAARKEVGDILQLDDLPTTLEEQKYILHKHEKDNRKTTVEYSEEEQKQFAAKLESMFTKGENKKGNVETVTEKELVSKVEEIEMLFTKEQKRFKNMEKGDFLQELDTRGISYNLVSNNLLRKVIKKQAENEIHIDNCSPIRCDKDISLDTVIHIDVENKQVTVVHSYNGENILKDTFEVSNISKEALEEYQIFSKNKRKYIFESPMIEKEYSTYYMNLQYGYHTGEVKSHETYEDAVDFTSNQDKGDNFTALVIETFATFGGEAYKKYEDA